MGNYRNKLNRNWIILSVLILLASICTGCKGVDLPEFSLFKQEEKNVAEQPGKSGKSEKPEIKEKIVTIKPEYKKVNIRPVPSTKQDAVTVLNGGDQLTLIQEKGNWLNISFIRPNGTKQKGWIFKYLVQGYTRPAPVLSKTPAKKKSPPKVKTTSVQQTTSKSQQKMKPIADKKSEKQVSEPAPVKPSAQPEPEKGKDSGISIL